jgi:lambda repressor-like predicted transcriptional regulator
MKEADAITVLAEKAWSHRKKFGYLKALPKEIQLEAVAAAQSGKSAMVVARAVGVTKKTIRDWESKYKQVEPKADFKEVPVVLEAERSNLTVRVTSLIGGVDVEITATSFASAQAMLKKLES